VGIEVCSASYAIKGQFYPFIILSVPTFAALLPESSKPRLAILFLKARVRFVFKFRRNSVACPWKFWGEK